MAEWQAVGWVHGVLNTDNMSIMGLTIDYGPYAFIEAFDEDFTPNGSDGSARYAYSKQPDICEWNLLKLAEAVDPIIPLAEGKAVISSLYKKEYERVYYEKMICKLGLDPSTPLSDVIVLVRDLRQTMGQTFADYTDTFQALTLLVEDFVNKQGEVIGR